LYIGVLFRIVFVFIWFVYRCSVSYCLCIYMVWSS